MISRMSEKQIRETCKPGGEACPFADVEEIAQRLEDVAVKHAEMGLLASDTIEASRMLRKLAFDAFYAQRDTSA